MHMKLPMYPFFLMAHGLNDFDRGKSITQSFGMVLRAQMALASLVAITGPQKVLMFRAHPFQWPL